MNRVTEKILVVYVLGGLVGLMSADLLKLESLPGKILTVLCAIVVVFIYDRPLRSNGSIKVCLVVISAAILYVMKDINIV